MLPLISIIIPVYNQAKELRLALDSIQKQTYKNLEIIVVDDGSTEGLWTMPARRSGGDYGLQFDIPVRFIRQEHSGAPAARNKGLGKVKGEYVIFWDADVVAVPQMLEKLEAQLNKHSEASFAYCNHITHIMKHGTKRMPAGEFDFDKLKQNNYIHSTSLIRKKDAIKWDESLKRFQDWDLWLSMAEDGKTGVWIDEYLFRIISQGTISCWLPSFCYRKPFCWLPWINSRVKDYNEAKEIIYKKHSINLSTSTI